MFTIPSQHVWRRASTNALEVSMRQTRRNKRYDHISLQRHVLKK